MKFPNLNGLRFIAAFGVIIHHIEQIKNIYKLPSRWNYLPVFNLGKQGVVLFFTLSGFLITYLLLLEKKEKGRIGVGSFYMRRVLRIWPLYFLIVILALFCMPYIPIFHAMGSTVENVHKGLLEKLLLLVFFLPNLLLALNQIIPGAAQTWSIGTEEQFYLFWPWIFKTNFNKYICLIAVVAGYNLVAYSLPYIPHTTTLAKFWELFNIDCMAVGGIFALLYFNKEEYSLKFFYKKPVQIVSYTMILLMLYFPAHNHLFSLCFGVLILNLATNPDPMFDLDTPIFNYLGKVSYGLYMYHAIVAMVVIGTLVKLGFAFNWLIYLLVPLLTIGAAAVSYEFFESNFIRMKRKFEKIRTMDETPALN